MLDIDASADYDGVVTGMEFHSHKPYASSTFKNYDEIRIPISQHDVITAPFESVLHVSGTLSGKKADGTDASVSLVNNAVAFLFDSIRYEINGIEVDSTKNPGVASTIKNLLSVRSGEQEHLKNACWLGPDRTLKTNKFSFEVPLKLLLGLAEDYRKVVVNVKQELILLRSSTDTNAVVSADAGTWKLEITDIYWRMPHITVSDSQRLKFLGMVDTDTVVHVPFRTWELYEYPALPQTTRQTWTVKTSTQLEKPRFVVLAFQTNRKTVLARDASLFDACNLSNLKLYLNSQYFPYDNINGDTSVFYEMFSRFQGSYYYGGTACPTVDLENFKTKTTLYVIDCSHQDDSVLTGPVDVRLEFEATESFSKDTAAYCLILHDSHYAYTMLTGSVKKVM